jgi:transcriptional regulator with XRE-family HTH domain
VTKKALATELPNRIRQIRESRKLNLQSVAEPTGCSVPHLADLERGKRQLTLPWMQRIAKTFGVQTVDLLWPADNPNRLDANERLLIERFRSVAPTDRAKILAVIAIMTEPTNECDFDPLVSLVKQNS